MPNSQPQGIFYGVLEYVSINGTGTGEISVDIDTVDDFPVRFFIYKEYQSAGN
jgi:hypothetical protein